MNNEIKEEKTNPNLRRVEERAKIVDDVRRTKTRHEGDFLADILQFVLTFFDTDALGSNKELGSLWRWICLCHHPHSSKGTFTKLLNKVDVVLCLGL